MRTRIHWPRLIAVGLCALLPSMAVSASGELDALLDRAEAVRSSDPVAFSHLLAQANAGSAGATPAQREQIAYLNAYAEGYAGRYDVAIAAARPLLDSADVEMRFRAGAFIVNSYAVTLRFTEGLRQLEQTLGIIDQVTDPEVRQHGLAVAAVLYNQIGQYELALHYADRILSEAAPVRTRCFALQYRIEALQRLARLSPNDTVVPEAIKQCAANGETVVANLIRATLARQLAAQDQPAKAIDLLEQHLDEVNQTKYPRLMGEANSLLGELLFAQGDIRAAERRARDAVSQLSEIGFSLPLVEAYKTLYDVAQSRGDARMALENYRAYAEADKGYLNDIKQREVAYQIVRQETELKNQQIELLDQQNQVLQLQQDVDRQTAQNTRLLALLLGVVTLSIGYWAYKTKRVQMSLRRAAETDALTGVCNRSHFTRLSEQTLLACERRAEPVSLVMFDLDNFKSINDRFGHSAGDWALQRVTETCEPFCRSIDHFGRLGGEEFAILLHGCDVKDATRLADDCRVRISLIDTVPSGHAFRVTASFGVASSATAGYSLQKLLSQSDDALYRAKNEARNCVRTYVPLESSPVRSPPVQLSGRSAGDGHGLTMDTPR
jgi:diguanylate cyclase (GGDEF)-like protein